MLASTDANIHTTSFAYDGYDRLATTTYPLGSTEASTYDADNNVLTRKTRAGDTIAFTYDTLNRLATKTPSVLPEICNRLSPTGEQEILRSDANVVEGDAFFTLCKGRAGRFNRNFGYQWFALRPTHEVDEECVLLRSYCAWLMKRFDEGLPEGWSEAQPGYVDPHAFLNSMSRIVRKRRPLPDPT